jgi:hypothetical protein
MERAEADLARLDELAADGNLAEFLTELQRWRTEGRGAAKLLTRIRVDLSYCPNCHAGELNQAVQMGQEIHRRVVPLPSIELDRAFVAGVLRGVANADAT